MLGHTFRGMQQDDRNRIAGCVLDSCPGITVLSFELSKVLNFDSRLHDLMQPGNL
jgi:hypothetical protein